MDDEIQKKLAEIRRAENAKFKPITRLTGAGYVAPKGPTPPPIDWRFWRHMPEVKQWEACALSLNINPDHVKFDRQASMAGPGNGPRLLRASFPSVEVHQEFEKRLRLLGANLFRSHCFTAVNNLVVGGRHFATLQLGEFAAWCLYVGLEDLPPELVAMGTPEPHAAPVTTPKPQAVPVTTPKPQAVPVTTPKPQAVPVYAGASDGERPAQVAPLGASETTQLKIAKRDVLAPVIESAQKQCRDPSDTAEVWATLMVMANNKVPPLHRTEAGGIDYLFQDGLKCFTRDALNKRLHPEKRGAPGKRR